MPQFTAPGGGASITIDTRANILASAPAQPTTAFATDTLEPFLWDGSAWYIAPLELVEQPNAVDMGLQPPMVQNDRAGYTSDSITDKVIYNSAIGGNANSDEGSIRTTDGNFQVFLLGEWVDLPGARFRENDDGTYAYEAKPLGLDYYLTFASGNSEQYIGLNGLPIIQEYNSPSMGAYPVHQQIVGRRITA